MNENQESSAPADRYSPTTNLNRPTSAKSEQTRAKKSERVVADRADQFPADGNPNPERGDDMIDTMETEDLERLAVGKRVRRNAHIRRALIARLLNEQSEGADTDEGEETTGGDEDERQLIEALAAGRLLRRRRLRRILKAKLLSDRDATESDYDENDEDTDDESGEDDQELARVLLAHRMLRRRRVRRALLAHIVRERFGSDEGETDDSDEDFGDDTGDREGRFIRLVVGSRILRRRRIRRAVLAYLLKERATSDDGSDEDEGVGEDGADLEREVARLLIGRRAFRKRRMRRVAFARHLADVDD